MPHSTVRSLGVITPAAPRTLLIRSGRGSRERFGLLLLILVTSYLISAFTTGVLVTIVQIVLFVGAALLALRSEGFPRRTRNWRSPWRSSAPRLPSRSRWSMPPTRAQPWPASGLP